MVDLDNLPPEERIKRLKEAEKKKQKEIEEARKKIKQSQEELTARHEWELKVPIPEVAKDKGETLEEKEFLRSYKGPRRLNEVGKVEEIEQQGPTREEVGIEELVGGAPERMHEEFHNVEYAIGPQEERPNVAEVDSYQSQEKQHKMYATRKEKEEREAALGKQTGNIKYHKEDERDIFHAE